ncbi:hypothetical protein MC7420_1294 [Coleofasciculus chthonoplastes PCC 7420]|uniref:Uncharacterized protein n=1 Tax=Coleofasciculus chthonoplastes PCC 7420 TaxID=118168 RepID=B4VRJ5_9CYAN|nr:hypothetical protein MC7420_1294 [Coleofasciculus chthonoplastes PCC 7420]
MGDAATQGRWQRVEVLSQLCPAEGERLANFILTLENTNG